MSFYENTLVTKQDLGKTELEKIKEKYNEIINNNSGKVIKIEEWGLLNLARKIKRYKKGFYIHYKFEGSKETLNGGGGDRFAARGDSRRRRRRRPGGGSAPRGTGPGACRSRGSTTACARPTTPGDSGGGGGTPR